jgi:myo-inositol-1(or 4)-monophosphatase
MPDMENNKQYLKVALLAAKQAAPIFKRYFGCPKKVSIKDHNIRNMVTEVDLHIEKLIRQIVFKNFPAHKVIGEEYGSQKLMKDDVVWIIDPIDGTNNFIRGIPLCCISIAVWRNGKPEVAVLYNPLTGQLFHAVAGKGAYLNNKKIHVTKVDRVNKALGGIGWSLKMSRAKEMFGTIVPFVNKARALGTTALQLAYVACGVYDYYTVNDMHIWDVAAGVLLIEEAGGKVTDWQGRKIKNNVQELVASNGKIHGQLVNQLKKISPA